MDTEALKRLSQGEVVQPLRTAVWLPDRRGLLGLMPAIAGNDGPMGLKAVSVMPGNHGTPFDSHQGVVLLFAADNGRLLAIMDATEITAVRTAAVSAVATRLLARADAHNLVILGSGTQAQTHLEAMLAVRDIQQICVWSRDQGNARLFAEWALRHHGVVVLVADSVKTAVLDADIICTTTAAVEPILRGAWLPKGVHINAVGSSVKSDRELDTEAVVKSRFYVDRRESTLNEAGVFLIPKEKGVIGDDHIVAEIGEILLGEASGRQTRQEITLFKSLGLAIEDVASAHYVYEQALARGVGTAVNIGGLRQ